MIEWRERFPRPGPDAVWCDECLRWEMGPGRASRRPDPPLAARVLWKLSSLVRKPGNMIANWLTDRAEEAQVRANIRNGTLYTRNTGS